VSDDDSKLMRADQMTLEHDEILRLRAEVTRLRAERNDLRCRLSETAGNFPSMLEDIRVYVRRAREQMDYLERSEPSKL
jgi:uncharacterized coiled-coil DUF342 family protein